MNTCKMPQSAINRINYAAKQQKTMKGLKFGDRQNLIDHCISTGVIEDVEDEDVTTLNNFNSDAMMEDKDTSNQDLDGIANGS